MSKFRASLCVADSAGFHLEGTIAQLKLLVAQQQKGMSVLTAGLKEQAARIQKVGDQLEMSKAGPQMAVSDQ